MTDRYKIYEQLGAGGVGTVFRAYDTQLKRWVAIKRLTTRHEGDESGKLLEEELRQEADSLAALRNPNIVTIFDVASDEEGLFIVMELLEGEDLAVVVKRGPLPFDDFKGLASQTLEGLLAAHQHQILHRDIKPENIKVERLPGGRLQAKIIDFGLARVGLKARKQTEDVSGNVLGSIHYMAPEQLTREPVDERTDLYALGCVFYEALSGRKAFDGPSMADVIDKHIQHEVAPLPSVAPHVPPWLGAWVERLMARQPDERPQSAEIAMEEFRTWERTPTMAPNLAWMANPAFEGLLAPIPPPSSSAASHPLAPPSDAQPAEQQIVPVVVIEEETPLQTAPPAPRPRPHTNRQISSLGRHTGTQGGGISASPARLPQPAPTERKQSAKLVAAIGGGVALLLVLGWLLLGSKKPSGAPSGPTATITPAAIKVALPEGRMMPPLDLDRCLHLVADAGTFQSGRSSDGNPFPAYTGDAVAQWHSVAERLPQASLNAWQGKAESAPTRVLWPHSPSGPSVKANRAALDFQSPPAAAPRALEFAMADKKSACPFGSDSTQGDAGATLAVVFQNTATTKAARVISLLGGQEESLILRINPAGNLLAIAKNGSSTAQVESSGIDASHPTIALVNWQAASGQIRLFAFNAPATPRGKITPFNKTSGTNVPPPSVPLHRVSIGRGPAKEGAKLPPTEQFQGLMGEVIVYASALTLEQARLLTLSQWRPYYFK